MAQQFYDYRILHQQRHHRLAPLSAAEKLAILLSNASRDNNHRELLTNDRFSSRTTLPDSAVASASTIPNRDARNIPLRVDLNRVTRVAGPSVNDSARPVLGIDDVRYLGGSVDATAGTLRQSIENR
ncbi:DUF3828 domain-containing protein [Escherichia coli]